LTGGENNQISVFGLRGPTLGVIRWGNRKAELGGDNLQQSGGGSKRRMRTIEEDAKKRTGLEKVRCLGCQNQRV